MTRTTLPRPRPIHRSKAPPAPGPVEYTVQEAAERTGLSEHTLRYYERAGLLAPVRRHGSGGHRRYSALDLGRIATLACLRAAGLPLEQMRRYVTLSSRGQDAAPELRALLEAQREVLLSRQAQMAAHLAYVGRKIEYWQAVESGDRAAASAIVADLACGLTGTDPAAPVAAPGQLPGNA